MQLCRPSTIISTQSQITLRTCCPWYTNLHATLYEDIRSTTQWPVLSSLICFRAGCHPVHHVDQEQPGHRGAGQADDDCVTDCLPRFVVSWWWIYGVWWLWKSRVRDLTLALSGIAVNYLSFSPIFYIYIFPDLLRLLFLEWFAQFYRPLVTMRQLIVSNFSHLFDLISVEISTDISNLRSLIVNV